MNLNDKEIKILEFFCLQLLRDYKNPTFNMPYLNFVFKEDDLENINNYLNNISISRDLVYLALPFHLDNRYIAANSITESMSILKNTYYEYYHNRDCDKVYIIIPDYQEFFSLLSDIASSFEDKNYNNNFNTSALLRTIFLRMGVEDINNINLFLKRQLKFIKNDYLLSTNQKDFIKYHDLTVSYENHGNEAWFETNRHIRLFLKYRRTKQDNYKYYSLPVIHYSLIKEDNEPTCYIYGIQNLEYLNKDSVVKEAIQAERRSLRNKEVSSDFIIALRLFIHLLSTLEITRVKIPLLQVFNYEYHELLSKSYEKYAEEVPDCYSRYHDKQDIISKNKTERLINTFKIVEDLGDIDIINEPFIEGDHLICKIKKRKKEKTQTL